MEVAGLSLLMSHSKDLKRDVGWMEGASSVGFLVGPMLGGALSSTLGFRTLFLLMSLPNAAMVFLLTCTPRLILPRGSGDSGLVDLSQHSVNTSQHSVISLSSVNSYKGTGAAPGPGGQPASASRRRRKAATLRRTGKAVLSSPTLPLYILTVLVVAGALGFMDTALSEHLVTALGASTFTAGLLFTIQITVRDHGYLAIGVGRPTPAIFLFIHLHIPCPPTFTSPSPPPNRPPTTQVYVFFSFCAGQIAHRVGRWRAVLTATLLWSAGMFCLGPVPALAPYIHTRQAGGALIIITLGVGG